MGASARDFPGRRVLLSATIVLCGALFMLLVESRRHISAVRA
jgi:hypothetical protein